MYRYILHSNFLVHVSQASTLPNNYYDYAWSNSHVVSGIYNTL